MIEPWRPENLEAINNDIGFALSNDGEEADAAAVRAFRTMRRFGLKIECLGVTDYGEQAASESVSEQRIEDVRITFGKYNGEVLVVILKADPKYFWWLANKAQIQSPELAEAVEYLWSRRNEYGVD